MIRKEKQDSQAPFDRHATLGRDTPPVCRLGLATRGDTRLTPDDVRVAIDAGVNYLNWCGHSDGMSRAIAELDAREREQVVVARQFFASDASGAERELEEILAELDTHFIDVLTFYYTESESEWNTLVRPGGALSFLLEARERRQVRLLGLTTHQRRLAASWARSGHLDLLMVRYNAAHRGAEEDVFPAARELDLPVVAFTCQRWGKLTAPTPADPPGFEPPPAREWYRFVLAHPAVSVALMAPNDGAELAENLTLLDDWRPPGENEMEVLRAHGQRVRDHARHFP